jgi:hypothetical protein
LASQGEARAANNDSLFGPTKPAPEAIDALLANIQYPPLGKCDDPCVAKETFRGACWTLWQHKTTRQYYLYASKRIEWVCTVEG